MGVFDCGTEGRESLSPMQAEKGGGGRRVGSDAIDGEKNDVELPELRVLICI